MFGDKVVISDGKFYPISKEANQEINKIKLGFLSFSCGTRQVPPKDGSEVSTASYQPRCKKQNSQISFQEIHSKMGSAWTLEGQDGGGLISLWRLETTDDDVPSCC